VTRALLTERLVLGFGKGVKPHILAALIVQPRRRFTASLLKKQRVPYSTSSIKRGLDGLVLGRLIETDREAHPEAVRSPGEKH